MKYLSLFSGIEACTVAWKPLGWKCVGFSEIEPFPCSLLAHHYPTVPNLGDITQITEQQIAELGDFDVLVFGSPCQDLSAAGTRKGFQDGTRSNLFYEALRIFDYARKHNNCRFALWENVPGAFSSNKGADFAAVVREMAGLQGVPIPPHGWGNSGVALGENGLFEWRVLDAQYFGLAQRRKRVFAIIDTGNWYDRPPILFEQESVRGDIDQSEKTGRGIAVATANGTRTACYGLDTQQPPARISLEKSACLTASSHKEPVGVFITNAYTIHADPTPKVSENVSGTLRASGGGGIVPPTLATTSDFIIRRLTPVECERLMGFDDDYTNIPHKGKPATNAPCYKALGNSMAVPVMRWIGERIEWALEI